MVKYNGTGMVKDEEIDADDKWWTWEIYAKPLKAQNLA